MSYKIRVDQDECIACGACTAVCDNFEVTDKAKPIKAQVDDIGCNQEAADICPQKCIHITMD